MKKSTKSNVKNEVKNEVKDFIKAKRVPMRKMSTSAIMSCLFF